MTFQSQTSFYLADQSHESTPSTLLSAPSLQDDDDTHIHPTANTQHPNPIDAPSENPTLLSQQVLSKTDAILERDVMQHLIQFLSEGGSPPDAIDMLCRNFRGWPVMCQLLLAWTSRALAPPASLLLAMERRLVSLLSPAFQPHLADLILNSSEENNGNEDHDNNNETISPSISSPSSASLIIDSLASSAPLRAAVYALKLRHGESSALLNAVVLRVASDPSLLDELSAHPHAVAGSLSVLGPVLSHLLARLSTSPDPERDCTYDALLPTFARICLFSERAMAFSCALLRSLRGADPRCARLLDDLVTLYLPKGSPASRRDPYRLFVRLFLMCDTELSCYPLLRKLLRHLLLPSGSTPHRLVSASILPRIPNLSSISSAYFASNSFPVFASDPIISSSVNLLSSSSISNPLLLSSSLSSSSSSSSSSSLSSSNNLNNTTTSSLLSSATAALSSSSSSSNPLESDHPANPSTTLDVIIDEVARQIREEDAQFPVSLLQHVLTLDALIDLLFAASPVASLPDLLAILSSSSFDLSPNSPAALLAAALRQVASVCRALLLSDFTPLSHEHCRALRGALREHRVVSAVLLRWAELCLLSPAFYVGNAHTENTKRLCALLRDVSYFSPPLRARVLRLLAHVLYYEPPSMDPFAVLALKQQIADLLLYLVALGGFLPVLDVFEQFAAAADQSLVRYFLFKLLDLVAPPYSAAFARPLLRIMAQTRTFHGLQNALPSDLLKRENHALIQFLRDVEYALQKALPPLEQKALEQLLFHLLKSDL